LPPVRFPIRSLVSPAFRCQEEWDRRLHEDYVIHHVKKTMSMGEFFVHLDQRFTLEQGISAIDVDIFANAADTETDLEQMEELLFKLHRSPHTLHTPDLTHHACVRAMARPNQGEEALSHLCRILEDRINYGIFLDTYTSLLVLDRMLEEGRLAQGARVASHLMLQEATEPTANAFGNLAAWRYLLARESTPWHSEGEVEPPRDEDPEDVVRIRVREGPPHFGMVPNNHNDDHFDLAEPSQILGKTIWYLNRAQSDPLSKSLALLGAIFWGKNDRVQIKEGDCLVPQVCEEIRKMCNNEEILRMIKNAPETNINVDEELSKRCRSALKENEEHLIEDQKKIYDEWIEERELKIKSERTKLDNKKLKDGIIQRKDELGREEEQLFFFDNQEKLEKEKESKEFAWRKTFPRRSWPGTKGYFNHPKWHKVPGKELKTPRWKKREDKRGPPK